MHAGEHLPCDTLVAGEVRAIFGHAADTDVRHLQVVVEADVRAFPDKNLRAFQQEGKFFRNL